MELDLSVMSRQERRSRRWTKLLESFQVLGSANDITEFSKVGLIGSRGADGASYTVAFGNVSVVLTLLYVKDQTGLVVCTTEHPIDARRRMKVFSFSLSATGETDLVLDSSGGTADFGYVSHVVAATAIERAIELRAKAAQSD